LEIEDQPVRKVVDLRTRNPTNFSLYFSDFSLNCYGISKFATKIRKGVPEGTIHLSHGFADSPLGFCIFEPEVLGHGQRGGAGLTGQIR
jgi:hypothetical protein